MKTVVLDTNFILHCISYKIDFMRELERLLDERFEACIFNKTLHELEGKKEGRLAKALIEKLGIKLIKAPEGMNVDSALLDLPPLTLVGTQDKALKEKLKKRGIEVISIRQKQYLTTV